LAPNFGYKIVGDIFTELAGTPYDRSDDAMAGESLILSVVAMEICNYLETAVNHFGDSTALTVELIELPCCTSAKTKLMVAIKMVILFTISNKFETMSPDGESTVNLAVLAAFDGIKQKLLYQKPDCEVQGQPHVHCILLLKRS